MNFPKVPCGRTPTCNAKVFIIDDKAYVFNGKELKLHDCVAYAKSRKSSFPVMVFVGVWRNERTGAIRYTGPFKGEKNARTEPDSHSQWTFVEVKASLPQWETMEDTTTHYRRGTYGDKIRYGT